MRISNSGKKVLILSPFFSPELISTGKYNTVLALALRSFGVDIGVIASHPLYPDWKPIFTDENLEGIQVFRGGHWLRYPSSALLRRGILEIWFSMHVFIKLFKMKRNGTLPDIVVPIFPPSLFFLCCSWLLPNKTKKIGIVHDLQGIYAANKKGFLAGVIGKAIHAVEGKGFLNCNKLVFLSGEMMEEAVAAYHLDRSCCEVIYPPASLSVEDEGVGETLNELFPEEFKHIVYSGALGDKQNPEGLAELFYQAADSVKGVMFHFFSRGPIFDALKERYADKKEQIYFHDLVDVEQLQELYNRSDVQILPQRAGTSKGSLPSKFPNLVAAGVRVLAITDQGSELESLVAKVDGAAAINKWVAKDFIAGLNILLNDPSSQRMRGSNNAELIRSQFSTEALVKTIIGEHA